MNWIASGFGTGRLRPAPGTWGSLAALCVFAVLSLLFQRLPESAGRLLPWAYLVTLTVVAIWTSDRAEKAAASKDPSWIVIDEWAGMTLAVAWLPFRIDARTAILYCAAFAAFRLFDVWKPLGIRRLQVLPGGWGIVIDDIAAGLLALALVLLLSRLWVA